MEFLRRTGSARQAACIGVVVALAAIACGEAPDDGRAIPAAAEIITLAVPGRSNANVSLATAGMFVAAVWSASEQGGSTDIYAATSRDGGGTFTSPSRVNSEPGGASASGEQPPRVVLQPRGGETPEVIVLWTGRGPAGTRLLTARSSDSGLTFSRSALVPGTDAAGLRGWQAMAAAPDGRVAEVWLDHRRLAASEKPGAMHHHHEAGSSAGGEADGVAMAQLSELYFGIAGESAPPRPLTGGVCFCCKTAMAFAADGALSIAWRHVYPGNMRDIAFTTSRDGGRTFVSPVRVSEDRWSIAGCPDDGPSLSIDPKNRVHVVWPTVIEENGEPTKALFHAVSADGVRFSPRVRLPTESHANHPQLAIAQDGSLAVIWDESGSGTRRIALARGTVDASGSAVFEREKAGSVEVGTYPTVAYRSDGRLLRAWSGGDSMTSVIRVARSG